VRSGAHAGGMDSNRDTVPVPAASPQAQGSPSPSSQLSPRRRWLSILSALMIVLGCLLVPVTAASFWARTTVTDTDSYVAVVGPLASDPQVQAAVEAQLTDRVMTELAKLDIMGSLTTALEQRGVSPALAQALALLQSPVQDRTEALVSRIVDRTVTSDAFANVWVSANRVAHTQLIRVLEGDTSVLTQQNSGQLVVDLTALSGAVRTALQDAGVPGASRIPDVGGAIVVGDGQRLSQAKTAYQLIKGLPWVLLVVAVGLLVGGVLLARRRWRATMLTLGGVLVAALLTLVAVRLGGDYAISGLKPGNRGAAGSVVTAVTDRLRDILRIIGWLALAAIVVTAVTGSGPRATALRRSVGGTASHAWGAAVAWRHTALVAGAVALVAIVVLLAVDLPIAVAIALVVIAVVAATLAWRSTRPAEVVA
jgi:hypothetical protein